MRGIIDPILEKYKLVVFTLIVLALGLGIIVLLYYILCILWSAEIL